MSGAWVSRLTPNGLGAIAVVRIEGPQAGQVLARSLRTRRIAPTEMGIAQILVGRLGEADGEEVVLARLGDDRWELGCHGGAAAVEAALGRLEAAGATRRAWTWPPANDVFAAQALEDISAATTLRTAGILLDQAQGALHRAVDELATQLASGQRAAAEQSLERLFQSAPLGLHLTRPWRVVLLGRPNVGKSSLLNALAGYERALTHAQPGTTRDVVTLITAFDGWPMELADTAGQRDTSSPLEAAGAQMGREAAASADLVLLVCDRSQPWSRAEQGLIDAFPQALVVHNKADLAPATGSERPNGVTISARTGQGLSELIAAIVADLIPAAPAPGAAVLFRAVQVESLRRVREALHQGAYDAANAVLRALLAGSRHEATS